MNAAADPGARMIAARELRRQVTIPLLVAAIVGAALLRAAVGGSHPAASAPAALLFAALLGALWLTARGAVSWRWRGRRPGSAVAVGGAGGIALVVVSLVGTPAVLLHLQAPVTSLVWWIPLTALVAVVEEAVLRGALFDAVRGRAGEVWAVTVPALVFAVIHLPLYGAGALGVDLAAGVFLGTLRVLSGGVAAPAIAHVTADLATAWIA